MKTAEDVLKLMEVIEDYIIAVMHNHYDPSEAALGVLVDKKVKVVNSILVALDVKPEPKTTIQELLCPDCGGKMISRTNRNDGKRFWGCVHFPDCRGTRDSEGKSKEERMRDKQQQPSEPVDERFRFKRE